MIILKRIERESDSTSFLVVENEKGISSNIYLPVKIANMIDAHLKLLSTSSNDHIERGNDEESD
jgi:hypothetical protein